MNKTIVRCVKIGCSYRREFGYNEKNLPPSCRKCGSPVEIVKRRGCCKKRNCIASDWLCPVCKWCSKHCKCAPLFGDQDGTSPHGGRRDQVAAGEPMR